MLKRVDTFNGILDYFPGTLWRYHLLVDTPDRGYVDFKLGVGVDVYSVGDDKIFVPGYVGFYYRTVTAVDELYYGTDYRALRLSETLSFGKKRRYSVVLEYLRLMPRDSEYFKQDFREQLRLNFVVEDFIGFTN